MSSRRWVSVLAIAVAFSGPLSSDASAGRSDVAGAPLDAIWRVQEFDLHIRTAERYHSCSSLHEKISGIMNAVGAARVVVRMSCNMDQLTNEAHARVATAAPVHATPENIEAATTFDTRQELIARLRDVELPSVRGLERFPAEWREVSLTTVAALHLGPGDCELLRGMNEQIFPHLAIRVVRKRLSCYAPMSTPPRPLLVVEALVRREA